MLIPGDEVWLRGAQHEGPYVFLRAEERPWDGRGYATLWDPRRKYEIGAPVECITDTPPLRWRVGHLLWWVLWSSGVAALVWRAS